MTILPQTVIEKKRAAWWAEHFRPGLPVSKVFQLNEQLISLFPMTGEEREQRKKEMEDMPEFVL
ncbi:MAG: hypothetical protein ABR955_04160 [Verrucomicrobiota bacterium]